MDKDLARDFATKHREFCSWFNDMTELTSRVGDPEVAKFIRKRLAEMLFALDDAVFLPMKKEYPDLFEDR
jgi:hypothetical protein